MKNAVFWGVVPCKCSRLNRRFGGSYHLHLQGRKIRERRTSLTSIQSTTFTWHHTPEDGILHSHRRENLKSYRILNDHRIHA
jgi:hypothetical protein